MSSCGVDSSRTQPQILATHSGTSRAPVGGHGPLRALQHNTGHVAPDLSSLLSEHLAEPFPEQMTKGIDYGEVDPVMIAADIYGYAVSVSRGQRLSRTDLEGLTNAKVGLRRSLKFFPRRALPYYERLLRIAELALARSS